ncbi:MAG: bifunctional diaminohydroxyphosphoribosylaminopyrimidine deaminase/5-amino-6-(5-phosphoribosylamino)uracil reductase RibD [Planctomycetes bacterium]|nr:bifunctional diaminohydroxyphosphoribosylaminopyrimidine deaminase/5-amino-6-(5-phosphoribosylamino)uracil reductase RibD [Planctomycetota bacterium]MBI3833742.1 bifunctional diaminohydroxyphosphoribosylaminopyrimidine deaminase/5-amino-6-(5-phosphoribosylamino)uracil reductase RibD [Planctomycetota bacterium]
MARNRRASSITLSNPTQFTELDFRMMQLALVLAKRGEGRVEPNPMVGCVIARNGAILGEGFHRRFGGPHAEAEALRACKQNPSGATAYVTLEPCAHFGKTPPCVDALAASKLARVVVPFADPNPLVNGEGIRRLRAAGVRVDIGLCANHAAKLAAPFLTRTLLHRPYVIAKWAQSLDGSLVAPAGRSRWISCPESLREVHRLRARVDAIMVGSGTVLRDNPRLTAREVTIRRTAVRVILDARLRTPENAYVVRDAKSTPTFIFTDHQRSKSRQANNLRRRIVEIVGCARNENGLNLRHVLRDLARREMTNVLLEGGPTLLGSFFRSRLVDEAIVFVTPTVFGVASPISLWTPPALHSEVRTIGVDAMFRLQLSPLHLATTGEGAR